MCEGEDDITPVEDVGTGVGYLGLSSSYRIAASEAMRFAGRGSVGELDNSNAGSNVGAGAERLIPATDEG